MHAAVTTANFSRQLACGDAQKQNAGRKIFVLVTLE
jgi:hypothetical protein